MRCPNCGQRLSESVVRCPSCGLTFTEDDRLLMEEEETATESRPEEPEKDPWAYKEQSGQTVSGGKKKRSFFDDGLEESNPYHGKMKWYWFIVHIQMLLSALSFVLNGYLYFTGAIYEDKAAVYESYSAMSLLDKGYGIFLIFMAALAIFTRQKLRAYKKGAPTQLIVLYILSVVGTVGYLGIEMVIVGQNLITNDLVMSIMISVFMICVNIYYFKHRNHLFCN